MTTTPQAPEAVAGGVHVANAPGTTEISVRTLERIVAQAIKSVPGTVAIDPKLAGIAGRGYPRSIVQADPDASMTAVDTTIAVACLHQSRKLRPKPAPPLSPRWHN